MAQQCWDNIESCSRNNSIPNTNSSQTLAQCLIDGGNEDCLLLIGELSRFLECKLGYARLPDNELIPITVIYSILFLTGMVGNVLTIYVISHVRYMHTATNLYLVNLAITDILSLTLSMTHELITFWIYYPYPFSSSICKLRAFIAESATTATVLTIMAVTVERYIAICQPLLLRSNESSSSLKRSAKVIAAIWLCSCAAAIPVAVQLEVVWVEAPFSNGTVIPESAACRIEKQNVSSDGFDSADRVWLASFATFFVVPLTVLTVLYILIGRAIRRAEQRYDQSDIAQIHAAAYRRSREDPNQTNLGIAGYALPSTATLATCALPNCTDSRLIQQKVKARRGVVRMLVAVVIGFFICWAPYNVERLMTMLAPKGSFNDDAMFYTIRQNLFLISGVLFYVSSTINPLLYVVSSTKFRKATALAMRAWLVACRVKHHSPKTCSKRVNQHNCRVNINQKGLRSQQLHGKRHFQVQSTGAGTAAAPVPVVHLPIANGTDSCSLQNSLVNNININMPLVATTTGDKQSIVYQVCRFDYQFAPSACTYQTLRDRELSAGRSRSLAFASTAASSPMRSNTNANANANSNGNANTNASANVGMNQLQLFGRLLSQSTPSSNKSKKQSSRDRGRSKNQKRYQHQHQHQHQFQFQNRSKSRIFSGWRKNKDEAKRDCVSLGELELNSRYQAVQCTCSHNSSSESSELRPFTLT